MWYVSIYVGCLWKVEDCVLQPWCLGFRTWKLGTCQQCSELANDASEPAGDGTTSAEGPRSWCRPEIIGADVSVVGMIEEVFLALVSTGISSALSEQRWSLRRLPDDDGALVQPWAFQHILQKWILRQYTIIQNRHSLLEKSGLQHCGLG